MTKFCIHIIIDKIYVGIVNSCFSQICNRVTALDSCQNLVFMPPTLKKWGAYCFRLVRPSVRLFVRLFVQKKIKARVLKFHIWIPRQKIAYPYFFLV